MNDDIETLRTAHARTQTLGLALIAIGIGVLVVLSLILFGAEDIAPFVVVGTIVTIGAVLTWRYDRQWARAVGIVATVISLGAFFLAFGVFQIFSPLEFTVSLAYILGFFLSLIAGIRALIAGHRQRTEAPGAGARTRIAVLGIIGVAAVVSVTGFLLTRETVDDEEAAGATVVEMSKFEFDPDVVTVQPDGKLLIENRDPFAHDFTLEELGIKVSLGPGSEALVDVGGAAAGTYGFVCTIHSDGDTGMVGTLVVGG
jgi:plastocyanin